MPPDPLTFQGFLIFVTGTPVQGSFRSGKSPGKSEKRCPVTGKPGNIDHLPDVREFENSWVENQNSAYKSIIL